MCSLWEQNVPFWVKWAVKLGTLVPLSLKREQIEKSDLSKEDLLFLKR